MRAIDPDLVERESWLLGSALRQVVEGLAGRVVPPLGKGTGVLLIEDGGTTGWSRWTNWRPAASARRGHGEVVCRVSGHDRRARRA